MSRRSEESWDLVLKPQNKLFSFSWSEIWKYRDLMTMFVKRDVVVMYKQTVLGPGWFFIQPILTTIVYMVVFGGIAGIATDGIPKALFYSSGIVIWNYFSESLTMTSRTFLDNAGLFGKVYFPRIIVPISKVLSGLLKFSVQFSFFLIVMIFYAVTGTEININYHVIFVPILIIILASIGLGIGIFFTSMTTKYRDLVFLIQFGVSLMMYATPVIYPLSAVPDKYKLYLKLNPLTSIVEGFRFAFLGAGSWSWGGIGYAAAFAAVILFVGFLAFNKIEKTFMDTV